MNTFGGLLTPAGYSWVEHHVPLVAAFAALGVVAIFVKVTDVLFWAIGWLVHRRAVRRYQRVLASAGIRGPSDRPLSGSDPDMPESGLPSAGGAS